MHKSSLIYSQQPLLLILNTVIPQGMARQRQANGHTTVAANNI